jgi:hypothetical protein
MATHDNRLEYTRDQLLELALTDNPLKRLMLATVDWAPFQHLELAGQLKMSGDEMVAASNEWREAHDPAKMPSMHLELDAAARKAAETATKALIDAAEAAFQLYRVTQLCECRRCQARRQRRNAKSN